ncbi:MAG: AAA family ATPase [Leptolyngbyaceae cyanobacterium SU_3_3]|nr:AAA family ATPase [Leptolyngbyaceae cyanobacterium SU_3_3]NJR48689.1 AAA family ATPase [Leptolyngbyaceae cyanobacterium CSU_1_3]
MILVCGGIKGGVGKTTLATNMAVMRANDGMDVLLVDADDQGTASDFTAIRNQAKAEKGGAGYTSIKLHGAAVRSEVTRMAKKYDDVIIDVGGRDTAGQRAALSVANVYVIPFLPGSFDVWTLESVGKLVEEARAFNETLKAVCVINRADAKGSDNAEAAAIAKETPGLEFIDAPMGNRKAFRSAAANGLAVTEVKPSDLKAIAEVKKLYKLLFDI